MADRGVGAVGEVGVAVAELLGEVEGESLRDPHRALGCGPVDPHKALDHLGRRAEHRLAVAAAFALAAVERGAAADRDERVLEQRPSRRVRVDVPRRDGLDAEVLGQVAERRVPPCIAALVGALQLDEEPLGAERGGEPRGAVLVVEREPVARAPGEADEALVQLRDGLERDVGRQWLPIFAARMPSAGMRLGEDPAEVRVAQAALAEQRPVRPPSSVTSAPVIGRMPACFAAWANSSEP